MIPWLPNQNLFVRAHQQNWGTCFSDSPMFCNLRKYILGAYRDLNGFDKTYKLKDATVPYYSVFARNLYAFSTRGCVERHHASFLERTLKIISRLESSCVSMAQNTRTRTRVKLGFRSEDHFFKKASAPPGARLQCRCQPAII